MMISVEEAKWYVGTAIAALAALFGFKNWQLRRKKMHDIAMAKEEQAKKDLDRRFDMKADTTELERLAREVDGKADNHSTRKELHRLANEVSISKSTERTLFEYIRQSERDRNEQHSQVMGQLLDISKRLPPQR